jgi:hypothetical protein
MRPPGGLPWARHSARLRLVPPLQRFSLVAYSPLWTVPLVHHRIKKNCHSDLRLYTWRGGAAAF